MNTSTVSPVCAIDRAARCFSKVPVTILTMLHHHKVYVVHFSDAVVYKTVLVQSINSNPLLYSSKLVMRLICKHPISLTGPKEKIFSVFLSSIVLETSVSLNKISTIEQKYIPMTKLS